MIARPVLVRSAAVFALLLSAGISAAFAQSAGKTRTLKIIVRDAATDAPIEGAEINAFALREKFDEPGDSRQVTNAAGEVLFTVRPRDVLPEKEQTLAVHASHPRYAPREVMFVAEAGRVRDTLPESYTFKLKPGLTVGGQVRDAQGKGITGVKIVVYGSDYRGFRMGSGTTEQQEFSAVSLDPAAAIVTDDAGNWRLDNFPTDLQRVTLYVTRPGGAHAQFVTPDERSGVRPGTSEVNLMDLHARKAVLVLNEGVIVRGLVTDDAGRPLPGAKLRARDTALRGPTAVHTIDAGPDGRFELPHWTAASAILTVEREGHATKSVVLPLSADMPEARIALPAAKPLLIRAVDETGAPIAGADVRVVDYRSGNQLLDWKAVTDAEGRAAWPGAPTEPVTYSIGRRPDLARTVKLVADGTEQVVRIRHGADRQITFDARVVDEATGEPIPNFEVWRRVANQPTKPWNAPGASGVFKADFPMDDVPRGWAPSYRVEIRAPGYATWTSDTLDFYDGDQALTIKLGKGAARRPATTRVATSLDTDPTLAQIGEPVAQLAQAGDVAEFVRALSSTFADMKALAPEADAPAFGYGTNPERVFERRAQNVTASARQFVELAQALGIGDGKVRFTVKSVTSPSNGSSILTIMGKRVNVPALFTVNVVLAGEPRAGGDAALRGDYEIEVASARRYPTGWRIEDGVRWLAVPPGVGSDAQRRELDFASKINGNGPSRESRMLSAPDDAALMKLGDAVVAFLRRRAPEEFITGTTLTVAETVAFAEKNGNSAAGAEEWQQQMLGALGTVTQGLLDQLDRLGIDLSPAQITVRSVVAERPTFNRFGVIEGLRASPVRITLAVQSDAKAKNGASIAGDYVLTLGQAMRMNNRWLLADDKVRWQQLPPAVVTEGDKQQLDFENYIAENRTLPPGTPAPEIEMIKLAGESRVKLSDYRGKVVVLEFWASWCGPCQEPMTKLQTLRDQHPEWGERVEIIAVSIDDKLATAVEHAAKKEWTKTFNTWSGDGGFKSAPPQAFRVRGIPTLYVLDASGKVARAGHPMSLDLGSIVGGLLK